MPEPAVLLIGHGSRDAAGNAELQRVADAYRRRHPRRRIDLAHIEFAEPLLRPALNSLAEQFSAISVVPLFLFAAGHVKREVPVEIERARSLHPRCRIHLAEHLGVHPALVSLARDQLRAAAPECSQQRADTLLLVVGRGSSDPDANGDLYKVTRLIAEGQGFMHVESAFIGITEPLVPTALRLISRMGPRRLVVLPYFLFTGVLMQRLADQVATHRETHAHIDTRLTAHLGPDPRLLQVIDDRVGRNAP